MRLPLLDQTEILALPQSPTPAIDATPSPVVAPIATSAPTVATPEQLFSAREIGTIGSVTATADLFDPNLADAGGCDPAGCTAALTRVRLLRYSRRLAIRHAPSPLLPDHRGSWA